ncbi:MAG: hypothetical protein QXI23_03345 [Candidatus Aenigmatarchaeota archaeon]
MEKIKKDILVMGTAYYYFIATQDESSAQDEFDREVMRLKKLMESVKEKVGKEKVEECLMNCNNMEELEQVLKKFKHVS